MMPACSDRRGGERAAFFEAAAEGRDAKAVANMVVGSVFAASSAPRPTCAIADSPGHRPQQVGQLVGLMADDTVSGRTAKEAFELMFEDRPRPGQRPVRHC